MHHSADLVGEFADGSVRDRFLSHIFNDCQAVLKRLAAKDGIGVVKCNLQTACLGEVDNSLC